MKKSWLLSVTALLALFLVVSATQLRGHDAEAPAAVEDAGGEEKPAETTESTEQDSDADIDKSEEAAPPADTEQPGEVEDNGEDKKEEAAEPAQAAPVQEAPKESITSTNHPEDYKQKKKEEGELEDDSDSKVSTYTPTPAATPISGDDKDHGPKEIIDETKIVPKDDGKNNNPLSEKDNGPRTVKPAMSDAEKAARKCPQGFSYSPSTECGPDKWATLRPQWSDCGVSGNQSPIHVDRNSVEKEADLLPLGVHYHMFESRLVNNGHSIVLEPTMHHSVEYDKMLEEAKENDSILYEQLKASKAGHIEMYGKKFVLRQFHFHAASEHTFEPLVEGQDEAQATAEPEADSSETEAESDDSTVQAAPAEQAAKPTEEEAKGEAEQAEQTASTQAKEASADAALYEKDEQSEINAVRNPISLLQVRAEPGAEADDNVEEAADKHDNKEADVAQEGEKKDAAADNSAAAPKEAAPAKGAKKVAAPMEESPEQTEQAAAAADEEKQRRLREQVVASEEDRLRDVPENTKKGIKTPKGHYDLEMHLIHEAEDGQVLIVAVFFRAIKTRNSEFLGKFWSRLPAHPVYNAQQVEEIGVAIDPREALPSSQSYYTYEGSLSAPPCKFQWGDKAGAEGSGVLYFLMKEPMYMSTEQLAHFHQFYNGNYRPVQELGGRKVFLYDEVKAQKEYAEALRNGPKESKVTRKPVKEPIQSDPPQGNISEGQKDTPHVVTNAKNGKKVIIERKIDDETKAENTVQAAEGPNGELSPKQKAANDKAAKKTNTVLPANGAPPNSPPITGDTMHAKHTTKAVGGEEKPAATEDAEKAAKEAEDSSDKAAEDSQESATKDAEAAANPEQEAK